MPKILALTALLSYLSALTFLSLFSFGNISTLGTEFDDKLNHFLAHAILVILAFNYYRFLPTTKVLLISLLTSICYGIIIEVFQLVLTTDRTFDFYDLIANFTGAIAALIGLKISDYLKLN